MFILIAVVIAQRGPVFLNFVKTLETQNMGNHFLLSGEMFQC